MFNIQCAHAGHTYPRLRHTNLLLCRRLAPSWLAGQRVSRVESGRADALTLFCMVDSFLCLRKTTVSLLLWLAAVFCLAERIFLLLFRLFDLQINCHFIKSRRVLELCGIGESLFLRLICQESFFSDEQHLEGVNSRPLKTGVLVVVVVDRVLLSCWGSLEEGHHSR